MPDGGGSGDDRTAINEVGSDGEASLVPLPLAQVLRRNRTLFTASMVKVFPIVEQLD